MTGFFGSIRKNPFRRSISSVSAPINSLEKSPVQNTDNELITDVYHLKQVAKNLKEYELEEKIELEMKMQEGTSKLLAACRHQLQALEAAKSLLTSKERMAAYTFELQRRKAALLRQKKQLDNGIIENSVPPSKARVAVSDIRMPLIWKDSDHFKNKGDGRRFAVFCLLKLGTDVYDTSMLHNVDSSMTDISFEDTFIFNKVSHNFEFRLEVYSYALQEEISIASASNKLKKLSFSVSKAIGKRIVNNLRGDANGKDSIPELEMVAHATLGLEDSNSRIKTYDLEINSTNEKCRLQLPLFGHFCCRMAVRPDCMSQEVYCGYVSLVQQIGNLTGSRRMWSVLKSFSLSMWMNATEIHSSKPDITIPVKTGTKVTTEDNASKYPRYTFTIEYNEDSSNNSFLLATNSATELADWLSHIKQHIQDYELWKPASVNAMEIPSPVPLRHSHLFKNRNSSLYDETVLPEYGEPVSSVFASPFYKADVNHRLSTPTFRSWSSSGSSTSSSNDAQHQQWPSNVYRWSMTGNF